MANTGFDNKNKFVIFRNDKKEKDTHPDMTGTINIDGVEYYLNAWTKVSSKDGSKFLSGTVKPKHPNAQYLTKVSNASDELDDGSDLPF